VRRPGKANSHKADFPTGEQMQQILLRKPLKISSKPGLSDCEPSKLTLKCKNNHWQAAIRFQADKE